MPSKAKYLAVLTLAIALLMASGQAWAEKGTVQVISPQIDGAFHEATGVAINETTGRSYISDRFFNRVQVFDSAGAYLSQFGTEGSGNGQLKGPQGIAIDQSSGDVYVADTANNRVQVFDPSGNYLSKFGIQGSADGQLQGPEGLVVDQTSGNVYVADTGNHRIQVFTSAGAYVSKFGSAGSGNGQFDNPMGLVIDQSNGTIYVDDFANSRIQVFTSAGAYLSQFGGEGSAKGEFIRPRSIAMDQSTDRIQVVDTGNKRVQAFAADGSVVLAFGTRVNETTGADICTAASGDTCRAATNSTEWDGVAVHNATGRLYAAGDKFVDVFDSAGNRLFQFGGPGEGAGELSNAVGVAINQSNGDVYLTDVGNLRTMRFDSSGNFISTWGGDVDQTNPSSGFEVCTAASGHTCKKGTLGTGKGQLYRTSTIPAFSYLAVGSDGKVFVSEPGVKGSNDGFSLGSGNRRVEIFSSAGDWISEFVFPHEPEPCGEIKMGLCKDVIEPRSIAVDAAGTVYTSPEPTASKSKDATEAVKTFTSSGNFLGAFSPALVTNRRPTHLATDPSNNHAFVLQLSDNGATYVVAEYDSSGKQLELWGQGVPGNTKGGIAVDPSKDRVYLSTGSEIIVMDTVTVVPNAAIAPASNLTESSAQLHGVVNPQGTPFSTRWHFEYRPVGEPTWVISPKVDVDVGNGTADVSVDHEISGLDPSTTYEARLVAGRELGAGTGTSNVTTFTTDPVPPVLSLVAATKVTDTTATLQAMIDPKHAPTTFRFEYGLDTSYGSQAPISGSGDGGSQLGRSGVFEALTGLQPGTTYHAKLVAQNAGGTVESDDFTFTTRTVAEMDWPERAMQLVNQPDVGNQVVQSAAFDLTLPVSSDGSRVLWKLLGGAPGSTTGYQSLYLSERTSNGWQSRHIGVPADEQAGKGDYAYFPRGVSSDLTGFAFTAESGLQDTNHPYVFLRMNDQGEHEIIADLGLNPVPQTLTVTSGASHVLYQNPVTKELIDFHEGTSEAIPMPSCGYSLPTRKRYASEPDASRIFVTSKAGSKCELPEGIFMIDRSEESPVPALISGPQTAPAEIVQVNRAGTSLLFLKDANLYRWSQTGGGECLTCGQLPSGIAVLNPFASDDLSHVYFCGNSLSAGLGCDAYVWREAGTSYITRVETFVGGGAPFKGDPGQDNARIHNALTTPDGKTALFLSVLEGTTADPTGWDENRSTAQGNGQESKHLYRYDDRTGVVECVSCSGTANPPSIGVSELGVISDDGRTVAFITEASLSSEDINGRYDVYEWHNGRRRLVTDGETEFVRGSPLTGAPNAWGFSSDGRTLVFSAGGVKITGNEINPYANAYAAVVGGESFPVEPPPAHCTEDACQGPLQAAPRLDLQGSSAFQGDGNARERSQGKRKGKQRNQRSKKRAQRKKQARSKTRRQGTRRGND